MKKMIAVLAIATMGLSSTAYAQTAPAPVVSQALVAGSAGLTAGAAGALLLGAVVVAVVIGSSDSATTTTTTTTSP